MRRRSPAGPGRIPHIPVPPECREMIRRGALFALNHSGGKDSQAMTILLARIVPRQNLLAVHAPLGEVEWPGTIEHIEATIPGGVPLVLAPVASGKTLLDRIEERGRFPSASVRWCTSDFKRSPIERELRRYLKAHPRFGGRVVNCMGHRADESAARAARAAWTRNAHNSKAGREWVDWLPVHALSTADVFRVIRDAGQSPHWAYAAGMRRLSCSFCIHRVPPRLPHRGAAPSGALSPLRRARAAHRPHAVAVANPPARTDGRAGRGRANPLRRSPACPLIPP